MTLACGMNGFGRFGLHLLKYWLDRSVDSPFAIRYINDDTLSVQDALDIIRSDRYVEIPKLYKISAHGDEITFTSADGVKNQVLYTHGPADALPWLGEPVFFFECSGKNSLARDCRAFLAGKTKKVVISATSWDADQTLVYGFNHARHDPAARVISYGSCTVNAYVPLAAFLHKKFGVRDSDVNVIHNIQDYKLRDPKNQTLLRKFCTLEKSGRKLLRFLNEDNFTVNYTVIPYSGISMMDFRFRLKRARGLEELLRVLEESFVEGELHHLYAMDETDRGPEVHKCTPHSAVFVRDKARLLGGNLYLQSYFDNENSVNRYHDLADYLARTWDGASRSG
jgi:glyceraldehyde 3-phosphate dehydrogenase